jgi:hypothetical protein
MEDFNKKLKERWHQKKSKAFNWTSLLIKIFILIAILYAINRLSQSDNINWSNQSVKPDTVQTDTLR